MIGVPKYLLVLLLTEFCMYSFTNVGLNVAIEKKIHLFFHALVSYNLGLLISGIYNCRQSRVGRVVGNSGSRGKSDDAEFLNSFQKI